MCVICRHDSSNVFKWRQILVSNFQKMVHRRRLFITSVGASTFTLSRLHFLCFPSLCTPLSRREKAPYYNKTSSCGTLGVLFFVQQSPGGSAVETCFMHYCLWNVYSEWCQPALNSLVAGGGWIYCRKRAWNRRRSVLKCNVVWPRN